MAFMFNFSVEDLEINNDDDLDSRIRGDGSTAENSVQAIPSSELSILSISKSLPQTLQADVIRTEYLHRPIYKRALSDVKFQIAQEDLLEGNRNNHELGVTKLLELAEKSDLVRGVYEGGFKTWECSFDLVSFLAQKYTDLDLSNKRVLELGCGSALPTLHLLSRPLVNTSFALQDYNLQVLTYITIPNILLNTELISKVEFEENGELGEVDVPDSMEDRSRLLEGVQECCRIFVGDWGGLEDVVNNQRYDLILTSETIYSEVSLPKLVHVIQNLLAKPHGTALVAAKTIYFGVGGGVLPFRHLIEQAVDADGTRLLVEIVMEQAGVGVKREILKISWLPLL